MTDTGFLEPRKLSPTGLAVVVALHAGALGALALMKGPEFIQKATRTIIYDVRNPIPEPERPPEPPRDQARQRQRPSVLDSSPSPIDRPSGPVVAERPLPPLPPLPNVAAETVTEARVELPPPVRVAAEFDPRYAADQQPPYPADQERAGREGRVRIRLVIGADGRVRSIERLSATNDAFWRATERHARARWRFRPATIDGRPVESSKTMTVVFELRG